MYSFFFLRVGVVFVARAKNGYPDAVCLRTGNGLQYSSSCENGTEATFLPFSGVAWCTEATRGLYHMKSSSSASRQGFFTIPKQGSFPNVRASSGFGSVA